MQSLVAPAQLQQHLLPGRETGTKVETEEGSWRELGVEGGVGREEADSVALIALAQPFG